MNLIRQRQDMAEACKVGAISKEQLELALLAPVFVWHHKDLGLTDAEYDWIYDNVMYAGESGEMMFPRIMPFNCIRISYVDTPVYEVIWANETKYVCFRCDAGYSHKDIRLWSVHGMTRGDTRYRMWMWCNGVKYDDETKRAGRVELLSTSKEEMGSFASAPMNNLAFLLFDLMAGVSTVIKVTPDQPGRSVQWRLAREHYLLINRQQAMKHQKSKGDPSTEDIVRSAHWRRAHLRRLSSDKYKNKKGLLVPVRKAWVGPDEWKGKDGKIYKVTNIPLTQLNKLC